MISVYTMMAQSNLPVEKLSIFQQNQLEMCESAGESIKNLRDAELTHPFNAEKQKSEHTLPIKSNKKCGTDLL